MYQQIRKYGVILAIAVGLQACATMRGTHPMSQQMLDQGAIPLTAEQTRAHLSGNTQVWAEGGAYFAPDGALFVKWQGRIFPERSWEVDDRGRACILEPSGQVTSCSEYFLKDGEVWVVTLEVFGEDPDIPPGEDEIREGNVLSDLSWEGQL